MTIFDIEAWVNQSAENKLFRQAVHIVIYSISNNRELQKIMIMKGGILLALGYESTRFTRDIDFSTEQKLDNFDVEAFINRFDAALVDAVDKLEYGVDCVVQGWKQQPPREDATFPTIQIRVGFADRSDQRAHRLLTLKKAQQVGKVDYSLNEPLCQPELLEIEAGRTIQIYSFHDLVAEKFRAVLQQEVRNRLRRQDVYDLHLLLKSRNDSSAEKIKSHILHSLKEKAAARDLLVEKKSMRSSEIMRRSREEYALLEREIEGPLPDFDEAFEFIRSYYEALPWD